MGKKTLTLVWLLALGLLVGPAQGQPRVAARVDLAKMTAGKQTVQVDGGQGLALRIKPPPDGIFGERLLVLAGDRLVTELEGGQFAELVRLELGPATYWIVGEYSGGAHCCGVYHFFGRRDPQTPITYWGHTEGHNGGPLPIGKAVSSHQDELYFRDLDNRFDYFHESHAGSLLVNLPELFLKVVPQGLSVDNQPFKDVFLRHAAATEREIQKATARRPTRPPAILKAGFGTGYNNLNFSDNLGQLLVKRTLYLLYAREDQRAWETFAHDVGQYYQTSRWVPELKAEIGKMLSTSPY